MSFRAGGALCVAILLLAAAAPLGASAQQRIIVQRGTQTEVVTPTPDNRTFFQRLFGVEPQQPPPQQLVPAKPGARVINVPAAVQRKPPAVAVKPPNPKADDARVVLVIGDQMAADLGRGLDVAFADRPDVRIETKTVDDAGLVATAVFDWRSFLETRLSGKPRPVAVVAMIGEGDGRPIELGDGPVTFPSERWETIYKARLNELMRVAREHAVPFHWVGLVPVADADVTNNVTYIDGVIRDEATEKGVPYVDVWEPFSQNGAFVASGPDLDGQVRQLRLKDGVGFTRSGARKLAFYVEQQLRPALSVAAPTAQLMQSVSGEGLVMLLNDPGAGGEDKLIAASDLKPPRQGTALYRLTVEGLPLTPVAGRYDATALR
jgi:hypothetical protein